MKLHKMVAGVVLVLTLATAVAGCAPLGQVVGQSDAEAGAASVELDGTRWDLIELDGAPVTGPGPATLDFDAARVSGVAFCNSFFATYERDGDALAFREIGSTLMLCPDAGPETEYMAALDAVAGYRIEDGTLVLSNAAGDVVLVYAPATHAALEGTPWVLTGYLVAGGISSTVPGADVTAVVSEGSLAGVAGCNRYSASITVDGARVEMGPAIATRMACMAPEGVMAQEQAYLDALSRVDHYEIVRDRLTFFDADGAQVLTYTASAE